VFKLTNVSSKAILYAVRRFHLQAGMLGLRPGLLSDCLDNASPLNKLKNKPKNKPKWQACKKERKNNEDNVNIYSKFGTKRKKQVKKQAQITDQNEGYSFS
jgi:hypothetical protein